MLIGCCTSSTIGIVPPVPLPAGGMSIIIQRTEGCACVSRGGSLFTRSRRQPAQAKRSQQGIGNPI